MGTVSRRTFTVCYAMSTVASAAAILSVLLVAAGAYWICSKKANANDDDDYEYDGNSKTRIRHGNL